MEGYRTRSAPAWGSICYCQPMRVYSTKASPRSLPPPCPRPPSSFSDIQQALATPTGLTLRARERVRCLCCVSLPQPIQTLGTGGLWGFGHGLEVLLGARAEGRHRGKGWGSGNGRRTDSWKNLRGQNYRPAAFQAPGEVQHAEVGRSRSCVG